MHQVSAVGWQVTSKSKGGAGEGVGVGEGREGGNQHPVSKLQRKGEKEPGGRTWKVRN